MLRAEDLVIIAPPRREPLRLPVSRIVKKESAVPFMNRRRVTLGVVASFAVVSTFVAREIAAGQVAAPAPAPKGEGFHLVNTWKLGGEGGWDYLSVDGDAKRVYVSRATHVMVVDAEKGTVAGDIPDTQGVHGIAIAADVGRGFTSNGRSDDVTIFELKSLKVIGHAKTGKGPDAILYDPASKRVFAFDGHGGDATAIDAASGEVAGTIPLGGKPEFGVADGEGKVFVNLEDKSEIVAIDSKKLAVLNHWSIKPGEEPSGLALDLKHRLLFSGCGNQKMAIVNADSGAVITTLPIGRGVDACAFDPATGNAFASCGDGTMTVIHEDAPDKFSVVENVATKRGARTMALDPKSHLCYLAAADYEAAPAGGGDAQQRRRPAMVKDSFTLLVFGK
jgi:DNA-binding beta-propeller fold protein YncE